MPSDFFAAQTARLQRSADRVCASDLPGRLERFSASAFHRVPGWLDRGDAPGAGHRAPAGGPEVSGLQPAPDGRPGTEAGFTYFGLHLDPGPGLRSFMRRS